MTRIIFVALAVLSLASCAGDRGEADAPAAMVCDDIPRPANAQLPVTKETNDWFQVYETAPNTYAIVEPFHFQEVISHLIVGKDSALLFDTGMGFLPIRPIVERITNLPVSVLNSHTHYDHVGGNHEFSNVLAVDTDYTRANMAGFEHDRLAIDLGADAFCKGVPQGLDPAVFSTKPWQATRFVADDEVLDLGGRKLQVLHIPGHTPDSVALLDAENRLLFTGDTYYDAPIWLFVPETSLSDYERSINRLAGIENSVNYLLGAHNEARVDAGALAQVKNAFAVLTSGAAEPVEIDESRMTFDINGIVFVTAEPVLKGRQGMSTEGGSGLDAWQQN